jgi:glycerophosphoryl diester phosphodiesterase
MPVLVQPLRRSVLRSAGALALASALPGCAVSQGSLRLDARARPVLLAHRGASVLVARHENFMSETTDIATRPEFASRKTKKTIDGAPHEGWFVSDFTYAELKTLRAVERLPVRGTSHAYDGQFQLLGFEEIIDFVAAEAAARGRIIGLVPELKHSTYFASIGLPLEERFVSTLRAHAYTRTAPVHVQSFETANLKALRKVLGASTSTSGNVRLVQLVINGGAMDAQRPVDVVAAGGSLTFGEMTSARGLRDIAAYADIVAPPTRGVIPLGADERLARPLPIVADAHNAGLLVHTWTFRPENMFLAADFRNDAGAGVRNEAGSIAEMRRYLETGIDGLFSDDTALARIAIG